jgi:hypothetical protein
MISIVLPFDAYLTASEVISFTFHTLWYGRLMVNQVDIIAETLF